MPLFKYKSNLTQLILIAACAIIVMLPSYYNGVPVSNDQPQHYQFASSIYTAVTAGDLYPAFAHETNHGFGDYGIRFYPPLAYYVLSATFFVVNDWYFASLVVFTLVFFVGGVGIYWWAKEYFEPQQALIAAFLYTLAPYHLNEIYGNFLLGEFFASAIIPFCFLFLTRVCRTGRWVDVLRLASAYSLLILTHLPILIICSIAMGLYALLLFQKPVVLKTLVKLVTAVGLSVVMTSFYWSRWLPELGWIAHASPRYFATTWDYRANYLLLPDHFLKFGENALNLWFADILLITILLVAIPTVVYLMRKRGSSSKFVLAVFLVLAFSVFMTTPLSSFIWDNAGFLQKVQFPWRWMAITSAFGAIFASVGIAKASEAMKAGNNVPLALGLGVVLLAFLFTDMFLTKGAVYVSRPALNSQMAAISDAESYDCWWPVWADRFAFAQKEKVFAAERNSAITMWGPTDKQFHIEAGEPVQATVATFYYPRWQATINGTAVTVVPSDHGAISLDVPSTASDVRLTFQESPSVRVATTTSIVAWLFLLVFASILLIKSRRLSPTALS